MIAYITCTHPECNADIRVDFDFEPADAEVGYPAQCVVNGVEGCDCEQNEDVLDEHLFDWLKDDAEGYDEDRSL